MSISDLTIRELQEAVKPTILIDCNGNEYSSRELHALPSVREPVIDPIIVNTLTGLIEFVGRDAEIGKYIHVVNPSEVRFLGDLHGPARQRDTLCVARLSDMFSRNFRLDTFLEQEPFIIGLLTLFVPTLVRGELLKVVGTIKGEEVREASDDGISQSVSARAGAVLVRETTLPNPVVLKPYRTFREIDQPESPFILRAQHTKGATPRLALFEADGGLWKLLAIETIREYLRSALKGTSLSVLA